MKISTIQEAEYSGLTVRKLMESFTAGYFVEFVELSTMVLVQSSDTSLKAFLCQKI